MEDNIKKIIIESLEGALFSCGERHNASIKTDNQHDIAYTRQEMVEIQKALDYMNGYTPAFAILDDGVQVPILQVVEGREILKKFKCKDGDSYVVLCRWGSQFVRWGWDGDKSFFWGHYFTNFYSANKDYEDRMEREEF